MLTLSLYFVKERLSPNGLFSINFLKSHTIISDQPLETFAFQGWKDTNALKYSKKRNRLQ